MSPSNSGFGLNPVPADPLVSNTWDTTPHILDNKYYTALVGIPWTLAAAQTGQFPTKQDFVNGGGTVMLNSDMSMAFNIDPSNTGTPSAGRCGGQGNQCARTAASLALINSYIADNSLFLSNFAASFVKMSNAGYAYAGQATGKLGSLTLLSCPL